MMAKKRIKGTVAAVRWETDSLALIIKNEDGIHTHFRNGERFEGKQKDCPLCATGREFEKALSRIGL